MLDASKLKGGSGYKSNGVWRSAHFALHLAPISSLNLPPNSATRPLVGVICPKHWAKRAVTRNTIKRQIYAVTHELEAQLPAACLVLRLASGFSREEFVSATSPRLKAAVRQELLILLEKITRPATVAGLA